MKSLVLFISLAFAMEQNTENIEQTSEQNSANTPILVKIEEDEYSKVNKYSSNYFGVTYYKLSSTWRAQRWSKKNKTVYNGYYEDEETAAHASDTLARKLMANEGKNHKLNFPDDDTEVYPEEKKTSSKFIGVFLYEHKKSWQAQRKSKIGKKMLYNGNYKDEMTAAHASDTLARKLMADGEKNHKLNFPDDDTDVHREKKKPTSKYVGVHFNVRRSRWVAQRRSKNEKKPISNGIYKNEEAAAHASDTLARNLIANGEHHGLNFPDDDTKVHKVHKRKRKRPNELGESQTAENFEKFE